MFVGLTGAAFVFHRKANAPEGFRDISGLILFPLVENSVPPSRLIPSYFCPTYEGREAARGILDYLQV